MRRLIDFLDRPWGRKTLSYENYEIIYIYIYLLLLRPTRKLSLFPACLLHGEEILWFYPFETPVTCVDFEQPDSLLISNNISNWVDNGERV